MAYEKNNFTILLIPGQVILFSGHRLVWRYTFTEPDLGAIDAPVHL